MTKEQKERLRDKAPEMLDCLRVCAGIIEQLGYPETANRIRETVAEFEGKP